MAQVGNYKINNYLSASLQAVAFKILGILVLCLSCMSLFSLFWQRTYNDFVGGK